MLFSMVVTVNRRHIRARTPHKNGFCQFSLCLSPTPPYDPRPASWKFLVKCRLAFKVIRDEGGTMLWLYLVVISAGGCGSDLDLKGGLWKKIGSSLLQNVFSHFSFPKVKLGANEAAIVCNGSLWLFAAKWHKILLKVVFDLQNRVDTGIWAFEKEKN